MLSKHLVAFIDVLGSSEKMNSDSRNFLAEMQMLVKNANNYCKRWNELFKKNKKTNGMTYNDLQKYKYNELGEKTYTEINLRKININTFSDNIVISIECYDKEFDEAFVDICSYIEGIQLSALQQGLLLRGGLVYDDFFRDKKENLIYGNALVRAHNFESKYAIYPRVIIDKYAVKKYHDFPRENAKITRDIDGIWYVNYFLVSVLYSKLHLGKSETPELFKSNYNNLCKVKSNLIDMYKKAEKEISYDGNKNIYYDKYRPYENINWVINAYNQEWIKNASDTETYKNEIIQIHDPLPKKYPE